MALIVIMILVRINSAHLFECSPVARLIRSVPCAYAHVALADQRFATGLNKNETQEGKRHKLSLAFPHNMHKTHSCESEVCLFFQEQVIKLE